MLPSKSKLVSNYLSVFVAIILIVGIFFRCVNLDRKVYWHDEVYTSVRVAGYEGDLVSEQIFTDKIISVADVLKFQTIRPNSNILDTLEVLATHPEHPPLYYLLARIWWQLFGSSVTTIRSLSVIFSLLVFPCIYWLAWELFQSSKVGWMAVTLVAVSPFHLLYAQEAREYSLWTVTILLASAALLRSIRLKSRTMWTIYAITLALNFYVSILSVFLFVSHALYVLYTENIFNLRSKLKHYLTRSKQVSNLQAKKNNFKNIYSFGLAFLGAVLLFSPWIATIVYYIEYLHHKTSWTSVNRTFADLFLMWQLHLSSIFTDIHPTINGYIAPGLFFILLIFIGYAIYFIYRQKLFLAGTFLSILIGVNVLGLILPDLIVGGQRSSMTRYFIPSFLGIEIAAAYLLTNFKFSQRKLWSSVTVAIVILGLISSVNISQADTWWNKGISYDNPAIARSINQSKNPILISNNFDANMGNLISLCYKLNPNVKLMLFDVTVKDALSLRMPSVFPAISQEFSDIFVLNQVQPFLDRLAKDYKSHLEHISGGILPLWKVIKNI
jgi:uncharacterized membrane protein